MSEVTLTNEQFEKLTNNITQNIADRMNIDEPKEETPSKETQQVSFNPADIAKELAVIMKQDNDSKSSKVYETLWNDKYNSTVNSVPGLSDFIDGEDDYGNVRKEQLNKIEVYEDKISALSKLTKSFKEASAGQGDRKPIVNKKIKKKLEEADSRYDSVQEKLDKGEYATTNELANDFFNALGEEMKTMI